MQPEKRMQEQAGRLKFMGWIFIGLALFCSTCAYFIPTNEAIFLLSSRNKEGVYVLSGFFFFLGLYCLGAIWRRRHFF